MAKKRRNHFVWKHYLTAWARGGQVACFQNGTWDVELYKNKRAEHVAKATVNRELAIIKRMFTLAVEWDVLEKGPASTVKLFREEERTIRSLDPEEQRALVTACSSDLRPIVLTAVNTGMRRGEIFDLRWESVDLRQGLITVAQSKSGRVRHIPINKQLEYTLLGLGARQEGYVFHNGGRRLTTIQKAFNNAVERAGIRKCRFHDLRHTFATNLVLGGVDLVTVKELMGHADIKMTMRYAHPTPEAKRKAVALLAKLGKVADEVAHGNSGRKRGRRNPLKKMEAAPGFEPGNNGFADRRLSHLAMPPRRTYLEVSAGVMCSGTEVVLAASARW